MIIGFVVAAYAQSYVQKRSFNTPTRYVFFAGLGGTGHHMFREIMLDHCRFSPEADEAIRQLWYDHKDFDAGFDKFVALNESGIVCLNLMRADSMLSYPDQNNKLYHPDVVSLAAAAEAANVDLRIVVLHRDPRAMVVSTGIHRGFLGLYPETQQTYNQLCILYAQLLVIDPAFYRCAPYSPDLDLQEVMSFVGLPQAVNASLAKLNFKQPGVALEHTIRAHTDGDDLRAKFLGFDRIHYSRFLPDICGADPRLNVVEKRTKRGLRVLYVTDPVVHLPCVWDRKANEELWQLWYSKRDFDAAFDALADVLRSHNDTLCLRPEGDSSTNEFIELYHEDLVSLAAVAEAAEADLRIVVVHEDPRRAVARQGGDAFRRVQVMYNSLCFLYAQLRVIDPAFYSCVAKDAADADAVATFVGLDPVRIGAVGDVHAIKTPDMKAKFLALDRIYYDRFLVDVC